MSETQEVGVEIGGGFWYRRREDLREMAQKEKLGTPKTNLANSAII